MPAEAASQTPGTSKDPSSLPLPPGPPGKFFTGHAGLFFKDRLGTLTRSHQQYGDVVSFRIGPIRGVMVANPDLVERILVRDAKMFEKDAMSNLLRPATGDGIFLSKGAKWQRQRAMVAPPFMRERIAGYGKVMTERAEQLSNGLKAGEVDMVPELMASALAIAARILFSVDVTSTEGKVVAVALTSVMDSVAERMNSPFPMPPAIPTGPNRRMKKAVRELDNIVYKFIAERRADSSKSEDLLTALLAARTEDGQGMTDEQIRDEAMTAFLAGFETSSLTMAWVVWLLAKYPEEQEKVRAALLSTFGDRPLGAADSKGLKPVDNVICEAMRLYPPIILVGRQADQDIELGGFRIPKGTAIWPCQWVLHRDPRYWSDPEKFVPDRWNEDLFKKTPKFAYFPFSGGPHHCVGNNIAMLEMNIVLGTLLRKWRFEPIAGKDPIPLPGFTLRPGPGVPLKLTPVKPAHSAVA